MIFRWQTAARCGLMRRWPFYRRLPMSKNDNGDNRGPTAGTFGVAPDNPPSPAPSGIHPSPLPNPVPQPAPTPKPVAMPAPPPALKVQAVKKKAAKKRPAKKSKNAKKRGKKKTDEKNEAKGEAGPQEIATLTNPPLSFREFDPSRAQFGARLLF
jgi:hypothetical protein